MGELIIGHFGGNTLRRIAEDRRLEVLGNDALFVREEGGVELIELACRVGDEVTEYGIGKDGFGKDDRRVVQWMCKLQEASLKLLCECLGQSNKAQWQVQPHYFAALILEIKERLKVLEKVYDEIALPKFKQ